MTKSIELNKELLERHYQETLDKIYLRYHSYTNPYPELHQNRQDCNINLNSIAKGYPEDERDNNTPHKKVVTYLDPEYCNGIRRRP